ncbi:isopeptide-forming domain-containing fimbrial protein [Lactobacillus sp. M0396]|uniref:isopeptide-forming domain-containing fimbrial protein n=1 Tax=Lactobacillus sp. M0396 TaxID=2751030 RepID=UPI001E326B86|nr:isopeptide-forming domain-containing fimbrial protein [Lactobacillus sp. M0396]
MKRLKKKQIKRLAATLGVSLTLTGIGVSAAYSNSKAPQPLSVHAAEQAQLGKDATVPKGKDIAFVINYQVPSDQTIKKLEFYDKLEPVFKYNKARVFDPDNNDVTDQGKLNFDKVTNTVSWEANDPTKWFGKKMSMRPEVTLIENADLSKYLDKNTNQYNIPNVDNLVINDKDTSSNPVHVHTPNDKDPTVLKQIEDKNGKLGDGAKYNIGDEFHYRVQFSVPKNGKDISNIDFEDDLEDVLDLKPVKVSDNKGNDITKTEGELKIDDEFCLANK